MKVSEKYEALKKAIEKAKICSVQAWQADDGGTSNFDSPVIDYRAMGMSKKKAIETIRQTGLDCSEWVIGGRIMGLILDGMTAGQGYRRTAMAKAFSQSLTADGIAAGMYYQCD